MNPFAKKAHRRSSDCSKHWKTFSADPVIMRLLPAKCAVSDYEAVLEYKKKPGINDLSAWCTFSATVTIRTESECGKLTVASAYGESAVELDMLADAKEVIMFSSAEENCRLRYNFADGCYNASFEKNGALYVISSECEGILWRVLDSMLASKNIVTPSVMQLDFVNGEIGVLIHFLHGPDPSSFNPTKLDTDGWIRAAKELGAHYALLTTKHGSGFCLWPTQAEDYRCAVNYSPWRDGNGDVVAEFIESCKKYGLKYGLYYHCNYNDYLNIHGIKEVFALEPEMRAKYNRITLTHIEELLSRYPGIYQIWFDSGVILTKDGGISEEVLELIEKYAPDVLGYQAPEGLANPTRWIGNEHGFAFQNTWATEDVLMNLDGKPGTVRRGTPWGKIWQPSECDTPNRYKQWGYKRGEEKQVIPPEKLMEYYIDSVGRNSNLVIGMPPSWEGIFEEADCRAFREFGELREKTFGVPLSVGVRDGMEYKLSGARSAKYAVIAEDVAYGERILKWTLEGVSGGNSELIAAGNSVGHKRIIPIKDRFDTLVFTVRECKAVPVITECAAY